MDLSVVISTYNRPGLLRELLQALAAQTVAADRFEVVVVDDGSHEPVEPMLRDLQPPYRLTVLRQDNAGAAAARHQGILKASQEIVVIVDDDMMVPPDFLAEHLRAHEAGHTLVLGHITYDQQLRGMPLFERFHAHQLAKFVRGYQSNPASVTGIGVCTGNVSFRRAEYLAVGGFDRTLGRSEDRELGVRLERAGARLCFAERARTLNRTDHTSVEVWMKRNFLYGVYDLRIARKHPDVELADPWRFLFLVNPVSRVLLLLTTVAPAAGGKLARLAYRVAEGVDGVGLERAAIAGATLAYGLEYFRGVREEAGSLLHAASDLAGYLSKRRHAQPLPAG